MKKIILLLMFAISLLGNAQVCDSISINSYEFPSVIINLENKSDVEIYSKVKSWANKYFKNPEKVTVADQKNEFLKISCNSDTDIFYLWSGSFYFFDLEIEVKENKYKLQFLNVSDPKIMHGIYPKDFYKKNGELKGFKNINLKMQKHLLKYLNTIHLDLFRSINKKNDW